MGRIPDAVVEEIRARADLAQVVGQSVTLKLKGSRYWGLCPFHNEKTPSFSVNPDRQSFYCFGCKAGGDVFKFRMLHDGLDFPDAIRALAREFGVTIRESGGPSSGRIAALYRANEAALEFFRQGLRSREGESARAYLAERGVPTELVEQFQIGVAPGRWDGLLNHLRRSGHELAVAEQTGLICPRQSGDGHYDRFRGRILFPILEPAGNIVGFGARTLGEDNPKYLNSPESPVYHKGRVLFGMPQALDGIRGRGRTVIVEGYFDVLALHGAGIPETVAPCGTALTQEHARRLRRYAPEVVLLFDGDEAGRRAAERSLPILLAEGLRVRAAELPSGEDPATLLAKEGAESLAEYVERSEPLIETLIDAKLRGGSEDASSAGEAVKSLAPYVGALENPVERASYIKLIAGRLELPVRAVEETVEREMAGAKPGASERRAQAAGSSAAQAPDLATGERASAPRIDRVTRELIAALAAFPELVEETRDLELAWLSSESARELLGEVLAASAADRDLTVLVSPEASSLDSSLKAVLSEILASDGHEDLEMSRRAVRDCIDRLWTEARKSYLAELCKELETCAPADQDALLGRIDVLRSETRKSFLDGIADRDPARKDLNAEEPPNA